MSEMKAFGSKLGKARCSVLRSTLGNGRKMRNGFLRNICSERHWNTGPRTRRIENAEKEMRGSLKVGALGSVNG
jgi:hypothetical protein